MNVSAFTRRAFVAALSAGILASAVPARAADTKPIVVGFFAPMTGNSGQYGVQFKNAIDLYLDQYNRAGGLHGRRVEIVTRDDQATPREAANAAQEFALNGELIAAIGSFSSTAAMAAAPIFLKAGIVQISPSSSDPAFTRMGNFMFRVADTQAVQAPTVAKYVVSKFHAKRIAVLYRQDDFGLVAGPPMAEAATKLGAQTVLSEAVVSGTADFRPLVNRLAAAKPDVLYIATFYADAATLAKQIAEAGLKIHVVTNSSVQSPQFLKIAGKDVEGWLTPTEFSVESEKPIIKRFVQQYKAKYGTDPDLFSGLAWDAIGVLTSAMHNATLGNKPLTRDGLREALTKIQFEGVTGVIHYDANRDVHKIFTWLVIKDGRYQPAR